MRRTIAVLMAVLMLVGVLTACSGTVGMDDGRAYGNVSTTPNGRVNGGGYDTYNGAYGGNYNTNGNGGMFGGYSANGGNQSDISNSRGASSGTGMTGGR